MDQTNTARTDARKRFLQIVGGFDLQLRDNADYKIISERVVAGLTAQEIRYSVDSQYEVPAIVYLANDSQHAPMCIALHQTTTIPATGKLEAAGIDGNPSFRYGLEMALSGYNVICPDYPLFGDYQTNIEDIYQKYSYGSVTAKGVRNHMVAIDVLKKMSASKAQKVVAIGHSLGGSNTLFLSLFDDRVTSIICSAGFADFRSYAENSKYSDLTGWARRDKYMPLIETQFGLDYKRLPIDFDEIISALAPRKIFCNIPIDDDVFAYDGAMRVVEKVKAHYQKCGLPENFLIDTPACAHDFPEEVRRKAYAFVKN